MKNMTTSTSTPNGVLAGLRVIELGQVLAGPFAGAIFADLGAEVLKIERIDGGDDGRRMGVPFRHGDSLNFQVFNRGKQSIALDLKTVDGRAALDRLVETADILVHNLRPGVAETLGIDGLTLCARHRRLIYCEMGAFGHVGPERLRPGYEPLLQAYSGLSSTNGGPDDPPMRMGASLCDQGTGMWAVIGTLAVLQRRHATGVGGIVNVSLLETALGWAGAKIDALVNQGQKPHRHRSGHPDFVPYEAFEAADGPFLICVGNERLFAKLSALLDRPDWPGNPRYATNQARLANRDALVAEMDGILRQRSRVHWLAALEAAGVPCAPINSLSEALEQRQVQALGLIQPVPGEDFSLTGLPISFDGVRPQIRHGAPRLGDATQAALSVPRSPGRGVAMVTGASSGIGAAVARMLALAGHPVVLCGRDAGRLAAVAEGLGPKVHILQLDMNDAAALKAMPAALPAAFTDIDILVNAAGHDVGGRRPFDEGDPDEWAAIIQTNLTGVLRLTHPIVQAMIQRRAAGDIVNIGSMAALRMAPRMAAHAASKAALHGFSDVLRAELGPKGIRVMEILPGLTRTGFAEARLRGDAERATAFYGKVPTVLTPEDVAAAVMNALAQPRHVVIAQLAVVPSGQW